MSKDEERLGYLLTRVFPHFIVKSQWPIKSGRGILYVDYYIPTLRLAFEVDGRQHEEYVPHFHKTQSGFKASKTRDRLKEEILENLGVRLIRFSHREKVDKRTLEQKIRRILG